MRYNANECVVWGRQCNSSGEKCLFICLMDHLLSWTFLLQKSAFFPFGRGAVYQVEGAGSEKEDSTSFHQINPETCRKDLGTVIVLSAENTQPGPRNGP